MKHLDWILHPAALYGTLTMGLALCLYLFFTLKRDIWVLERRRKKAEAAFAELLGGMRADLDTVRENLRETDEKTGLLVPPAPPRSGLNLNKRSQALRMYRNGSAPEQIAETLGLPRSEVDLLLKVQRILLENV